MIFESLDLTMLLMACRAPGRLQRSTDAICLAAAHAGGHKSILLLHQRCEFGLPSALMPKFPAVNLCVSLL